MGPFRRNSANHVPGSGKTTLALHAGMSGGLALSPAGAPVGILSAGLVRRAAMIVPPGR